LTPHHHSIKVFPSRSPLDFLAAERWTGIARNSGPTSAEYAGAFLIAAKAGIPVLPAVMRGTRHLFAEGQKLPRWSSIDVEFFESIAPPEKSSKDAEALREAAHNVMRSHCGELEEVQTATAAQTAPTAKRSYKIGVNLQ
jgi:1-acyl-sn-glycerol-3-phosphate acyltransferase